MSGTSLLAGLVVALMTGAVAVLVTNGGATAVAHRDRSHPRAPGTGGSRSVSPVSSAPATAPSARLVLWKGPVEGIFVHPLVLRPRAAFTGDRLGRGFQDYFVTALEFRRILVGLWHNGWTLVDAHRAATGRVRVPVGRKPLVLSEDDVNYYAYFRGRGLAARLVLDRKGDVRAERRDRLGRHLTTRDVVPMVDGFVARHPQFSAEGAKGVLALTGYEGLFGEHHLSRPSARARVRALAARLRATGWTFASHTYGHIDLTDDSLATIGRDTRRWKRLTHDLIGSTDLLIYPFGARPTDEGVRLLLRAGFRVQFDIDIRPRRLVSAGVVVMSRLHIDGLAFEDPDRMAPLFSVWDVRDPARP